MKFKFGPSEFIYRMRSHFAKVRKTEKSLAIKTYDLNNILSLEATENSEGTEISRKL